MRRFGYFRQAFCLFFQLTVRFAIQRRGEREFPGGIFFLTQSLICAGQFIVDGTIVIVGNRNLELLLGFAIVL